MIHTTIGFQELRILCSIGVLPQEKQAIQEIVVTLEVDVEVGECLQSDLLKDTIDYAALVRFCSGVVKKRHYNLLENLAGEIVEGLGRSFPIQRARIEIKKPGAFADAQASFVRMERIFA